MMRVSQAIDVLRGRRTMAELPERNRQVAFPTMSR